MFNNISTSSTSPTKNYFSELLFEMTQLVESPIEYKYSQRLLSQEIRRVWKDLDRNLTLPTDRFETGKDGVGNYFDDEISYMRLSPGDAPPHIHSTPYYPKSKVSNMFDSEQFLTPIRFNENSHISKFSDEVSQITECSESSPLSDTKNNNAAKYQNLKKVGEDYVLQTKVMIPGSPQEMDGQPVKCNFIGRILGPSGYSAKLIERNYNVTLLIRGKGSLKDAKKEAESIGKKGFEHLIDPLHVLLIAKHSDRKKCEEILSKASRKIESLLTPVHDKLKTDQLLRLAVMKGNYVKKLA